jgi:CRP-like cAMP-binding protein
MHALFDEIGAEEERRSWTRVVLGRCPALRQAPRTVRDAIAQVGRVVRARRRALILTEGRASPLVLVLAEGRVRLERERARGEVLHLAHCGPGDVVGDVTLAGEAMAESAVVTDTVTALALDAHELRELAARDPAIAHVLARAVRDRTRSAEARLETLMTRNVEARLAVFLLHALERWGTACAEGTRIDTTLRHHEIGRMVGAGREWVTMTLIDLRSRRILAGEGRRIVVCDVEALRRLAAGV